MSSPAHVLRKILIDAGLVILPQGQNVIPIEETPGTGPMPCYVSSIPDTPDELVCILNNEGTFFGRDMRSTSRIHPAVRVFVRTLTDTGYENLCVPIASALDAIAANSTIVLDGTSYYIQSVYRTSSILTLGEEVPKQRQRWMLHARVAFQNRQSPIMG